MGYGMDGHVGISFQNSFGTSYASSMDYFPIINESLVENLPTLQSEGMIGRFEGGQSYRGPADIAGDIVFEVHPILIGKLLKAWCGQSSSSEVASGSGVYKHTFKPCTEDFDVMAAVPPMTIEVYRDAGSAHQYYDCLCSGFSLEIAHGTILKSTMSLLGGKFEKKAKTSPTYFAGSEYTWDQSSISIAGVAVDELSQITITGDNALEGRGTIDGSYTFNRIKRSSFRTMTFAGTILFMNDDEFDNFRNQTEQAVVVSVTGGTLSGAHKEYLKIDMPKIHYDEFPVNLGGPGLIEVGFSAGVKYHTTSATMVEFTIQNTQASY